MMKRFALGLVAAAAAFAALPAALSAELPPLIPRDVLFGNPEKVAAAPLARRQAARLDRAGQEERPAGLGQDHRQGRRQDRHRRQEARHPPVPLGREQQDAALPPGQRRRRELPRLRRRSRLGQRPRLHAVPGSPRRRRRTCTRTSPTSPGRAQRAQPPGHGRLPLEPDDRRADARHGEPRRRRRLGGRREVPGPRRAGRDARRRHRDPRPRRREVAVEDARQGRARTRS